jgi:hypothetical protein
MERKRLTQILCGLATAGLLVVLILGLVAGAPVEIIIGALGVALGVLLLVMLLRPRR